MASFAAVLAARKANAWGGPITFADAMAHGHAVAPAPSCASFPAYNPPAWNASIIAQNDNNKRRRDAVDVPNKTIKDPLARGNYYEAEEECGGFRYEIAPQSPVHPYLSPMAALNHNQKKPAALFGMALPKQQDQAAPFGMALPKQQDQAVYAEDILGESGEGAQGNSFAAWANAVQEGPSQQYQCDMYNFCDPPSSEGEFDDTNSPPSTCPDYEEGFVHGAAQPECQFQQHAFSAQSPQVALRQADLAEENRALMEELKRTADLAEENRALMEELKRTRQAYAEERHARMELEHEVVMLKQHLQHQLAR